MEGVSPPVPREPEPSGWRRDGPRFALVAWVIATVVVALSTAFAALFVTLTAVVGVVLAGERSRERFEAAASDAIASPAFSWSALIASQAALLACAWLACRALRKPARERLGLRATRLGPLHGAILLCSTSVPFALGLLAAWLVGQVVDAPDDDALGLQRMWSEGSPAASAAWILLIALVPGFVEELFYRGFLQRGLLLRWKPATAIVTSSLLFALVHGGPATMAAIFPLGLWLGFVAWRTGSMVMTFAMHATLNGAWTAAMMVLHRDPASETTLNAMGLALLGVGLCAFPWALVLLRRLSADAPDAAAPPRLLPRVAGTALVAGSLAYVLVPPAIEPPAAAPSANSLIPALGELEERATGMVVCTAAGETGAVEFSLSPGTGTTVTLPPNRAGVDRVVVSLDDAREVVWLAYAGGYSGKGGGRRPTGIVEQLASGEPTVLCLTLSDGPPPVRLRLWIADDEAGKASAFERAAAEGWAARGRF